MRKESSSRDYDQIQSPSEKHAADIIKFQNTCLIITFAILTIFTALFSNTCFSEYQSGNTALSITHKEKKERKKPKDKHPGGIRKMWFS